MDLTTQAGSELDNGNVIALSSRYETADGQTHQMADVWFAKSDTAPGTDGQGPTMASDLLVAAPEAPLADGAAVVAATQTPMLDGGLLAAQASAQALEELLRQQPII
jgi:hypothetical protein